MIFTETKLAGSFLVELEQIEDERGFFARSWCAEEFKKRGLNPNLVQCNISHNKLAGTFRGMHYQAEPHPEAKLVRCTRGKIFDVIVDIRPSSTTFKQWVGVELSAENRRALYIPEGMAHGFLTLIENTEVMYQMSEYYHPECSRGIRWNDPALGIKWPREVELISERDSSYEIRSTAQW